VQDNGIGISKSDQKKIFKIDSGFSNPGTENEKGSGLGLILIKEFIQYHNGLIKIESETGIGTKVIFTLPLHQNS
jgi:signal transduction histidine kinase